MTSTQLIMGGGSPEAVTNLIEEHVGEALWVFIKSASLCHNKDTADPVSSIVSTATPPPFHWSLWHCSLLWPWWLDVSLLAGMTTAPQQSPPCPFPCSQVLQPWPCCPQVKQNRGSWCVGQLYCRWPTLLQSKQRLALGSTNDVDLGLDCCVVRAATWAVNSVICCCSWWNLLVGCDWAAVTGICCSMVIITLVCSTAVFRLIAAPVERSCLLTLWVKSIKNWCSNNSSNFSAIFDTHRMNGIYDFLLITA